MQDFVQLAVAINIDITASAVVIMMGSVSSIAYGVPNLLSIPSMQIIPREEGAGRSDVARQIRDDYRR